jgi:hypothetical protein
MVTKLGVMAGLEQSLPDDKVGGVGGVPGMDAVAPALEERSLAAMDQRLSTLAAKSTQLEAFFRDQKVLLASTPSIWPVRGYCPLLRNRIDPLTCQPDFHHRRSHRSNADPCPRRRRGDRADKGRSCIVSITATGS